MSKLIEFLHKKAQQHSKEERQEQIKEQERIAELKNFLDRIHGWLTEAEDEGLLTIGVQDRIIGTHFTTQTPVLVINTPEKEIHIIPQENELGRIGVQIGKGDDRVDLWQLEDEKTGKKRWVSYHTEEGREVTRELFEELIIEQLS